MAIPLKLLVLCLITSTFTQNPDDDVQEFIKMLREKIWHLEKTGQIHRDYEPYFESQLADNETYDFIIVGAGSAGSAIVHRLTEITNWKILLLEAGGEPDILSDIPYWSPIVHLTDLNWRFLTEKEDNFALGLEEQRMHWPRGKALGGTSLLNYMVFSRCAKEDYDRWAALGNPGWSYTDVLPTFKKMESCEIHRKDKDFRGNKGPLHVEDSYATKSGKTFLKAAKNGGYKLVDYNGKQHIGASYPQATTKRGLRCSGERCYIKPIKNRKNLTIRMNSHVTKILIQDHKAYGVEFQRGGKIYRALASKEVILSAGVINSAHILLLSGVGPKEQLDKFGIETIQDLPVGKKIYDHPAYWGLGVTFNESIIYDAESALKEESFKKLYNKGGGILHDLGGIESLIFTRTPLAKDNRADVEIIFLSNHFIQGVDKGLGATIRITKEMYENTYKIYEGTIAASLIVILMHPESFGHMELQSADPLVYPKIYGGYFTDPSGFDVKTMIAGIREAIRVMLSPPFDKYGTKIMDQPLFGCGHHRYDSDEYWECALRHLTSTVFHPTTTCKMGPAHDPEAVVDNRLRVYGVKNLRVADTAVIPIQLTGHTNVPAYLVGEKMSEMLKEEYLY